LRKGTSRDGELSLGARKYDDKKPMNVKRPRIDHSLPAKPICVVALAVGGMKFLDGDLRYGFYRGNGSSWNLLVCLLSLKTLRYSVFMRM
jgi:hypothetical protein